MIVPINMSLSETSHQEMEGEFLRSLGIRNSGQVQSHEKISVLRLDEVIRNMIKREGEFAKYDVVQVNAGVNQIFEKRDNYRNTIHWGGPNTKGDLTIKVFQSGISRYLNLNYDCGEISVFQPHVDVIQRTITGSSLQSEIKNVAEHFNSEGLPVKLDHESLYELSRWIGTHDIPWNYDILEIIANSFYSAKQDKDFNPERPNFELTDEDVEQLDRGIRDKVNHQVLFRMEKFGESLSLKFIIDAEIKPKTITGCVKDDVNRYTVAEANLYELAK